MTGPIFSVTVPAIMTRSLCRGLGRNTPAPNRSISKRPAPVAIISIAQHASPKVIGQIADLRAQLTVNCAGFESITGATILRRTKFVIASTVVRTNPSSCSIKVQGLKSNFQRPKCLTGFGLWTWDFGRRLHPFERAFAPRVVITNYQNSDEDKH